MIIREIQLKNFGKFSGRSIRFSEGINVIYGENESGKTTIFTAIGALLFGIDKKRGRASKNDMYTTYQPWENSTYYEAAMRFETGGKLFFLERNFYPAEKKERLICETDGEELDISGGDLDVLLDDTASDLFFNTVAAARLSMKPRDIVYDFLKNYIAGLQEDAKHATDVVKALEILEKKRKALEQEDKKRIAKIRQEIQMTESKIELLEKEKADCMSQVLLWEKSCREEECEKALVKGFWARLLLFLKKIFLAKRFREEKERQRQEYIKKKERVRFLKEALGEKESHLEEFFLLREQLYEKLKKNPWEAERKAIDFAVERIYGIAVVREEEVMEQLRAKASKTLCSITGGKYQKLILEKNGEVRVWDGRRMLRLFQLSAGCADQIYLSIRIALQDLFFEDETMPLIFDDAFVYFDDKRLAGLLGLLCGLRRQVLIFTCGKREETLLRENGQGCYTINLSDD